MWFQVSSYDNDVMRVGQRFIKNRGLSSRCFGFSPLEMLMGCVGEIEGTMRRESYCCSLPLQFSPSLPSLF